MTYQPPPPLMLPWLHKGLFNCCSDCTTCCVTCWAPCVTYAEIGRLLHNSNDSRYLIDLLLYFAICISTGCHCLLGMIRREELRRKYCLQGTPCHDCCVHWFCHRCALCQEYRELKARDSITLPMPLHESQSVYTAAGGIPQTYQSTLVYPPPGNPKKV